MKMKNAGIVKQKTPLRLMRESLNPPMTLQAVAAKVRGIAAMRDEDAGCSFGHLSGVERGSSQVSVKLLALLAEVYGRPRAEVTAAYQAGRMIHQRKKMSAPDPATPSGLIIGSYGSGASDLAHVVVEED